MGKRASNEAEEEVGRGGGRGWGGRGSGGRCDR